VDRNIILEEGIEEKFLNAKNHTGPFPEKRPLREMVVMARSGRRKTERIETHG